MVNPQAWFLFLIGGSEATVSATSWGSSLARDRKLRGPLLWAGRLATVIGCAANAGPFLLGLPRILQRGQDFVLTQTFERWNLSQAASTTTVLGLSPEFIYGLVLLLDAVVLLGYWTIALLLFFRYSNRWYGLVVPYILCGLGVGFTLSLSESWRLGIELLPPWLELPTEIMATFIWPAFFFSLYVFPDGRFVPRWSWLLALGLPILFILAFVTADNDTPVLVGALFFIIAAGVVSQVYRYRSVSTPAQRQQTKWFVLGMAFFSVTLAGSFLVVGSTPEQRLLWSLIFGVTIPTLATLFLAAALTIALTKYRLWEVDGLINRALVYGLLTTVLAAVFAGSTAMLNQILASYLGEASRGLAPVLSAVLIAAIFQPTRRALESWIEKRFYPKRKELWEGLLEIEEGYWPFVSRKALLGSSLEHLADFYGCTPLAAYLTEDGSPCIPAAAHELPVDELGPLQLTQEQLLDFQNKRVTPAVNDGEFVGLVPLQVPGKPQSLLGVVAFGPRSDGRGYAGEDLKALVDLGEKIARALYAIRLREAQMAAGVRSIPS